MVLDKISLKIGGLVMTGNAKHKRNRFKKVYETELKTGLKMKKSVYNRKVRRLSKNIEKASLGNSLYKRISTLKGIKTIS